MSLLNYYKLVEMNIKKNDIKKKIVCHTTTRKMTKKHHTTVHNAKTTSTRTNTYSNYTAKNVD